MEVSDPLVDRAGFTFVEEDDVAFTLQLCREVHRLYGDYQAGGLPSGDYVLAGLTVTMEMLAALSGTVTGGMPAMRITVAAAQTREMLAVMFGRDPLDRPLDDRYRAQYRAIVDESARALGSQPPPLPPGWAEAALGRGRAGLAAGSATERSVDEPPAGSSATGSARHLNPGRRSLLRRLFGRRAE